MLFFTNTTRRSETVLYEQVSRLNGQLPLLRELKNLASVGRELLLAGELDEFGSLLDTSWKIKKQLASRVSNSQIDEMYSAARRAGALGGKIAGAGGGGFLLFYCPRHRQDDVRLALRALPEMPFRLERDGSKVIFNYRR